MVKSREGRTSGKIIGIMILAILLLTGVADAQAIISVSTSPPDLYPQPTGGGTYYYDPIDSFYPEVTVTAQPVIGYTFQRWTEDGEQISTSASYTFNVYGNRSLVAEYSRNQYNISVSTSPSDLDPQPTGGGTYYYGDTATVTAQPVEGYTFQRWNAVYRADNDTDINEVSTSASYSFNVTGNLSLVAEYSRNQYNISVSTSPSDLNPQPAGVGTYYYGDTATVVAQPVEGYIFQNWTEDGEQVSTSTSYSFTVIGNQTLMAEYTILTPTSTPTPPTPTSIPYTVSVSTSPSGLSPQPTGGGTYNNGTTATVTAQPVTGYIFQKWTENGNTVSTSDSYRFTITGDRKLMAEYSKEGEPSIIIEPSSGTPGSEITVEGTGFKISAEESPKVSIYLDDRVVKEEAMERDASGSSGSFRTTFIVPSNITSGYYRVVAKGLTDSAGADFEVNASVSDSSGVEPIEPILVYIAEISSIIAAVALLKYLLKKTPTPQTQQIKKQLPIKIETTGGIESTYYREHAIDVEVRGGAERL